MPEQHNQYMSRCVELARLGAGYVAPNPMVGAVLVHKDRIIGEGYHQRYGETHAEVNCIASVKPEDRALISQSTLYVSLEPCAHFGKTPPCADLIIREKIPVVVIGCRDPFKEVDGKGIEKLKAAGVEVITGVMEKECRELNQRFFTFHTQHRPWIVLKWAQTGDGKIGSPGKRLLISNEVSNRLVHKWRSEEASILVGTNTALWDDPRLTTRLWEGPSPVRLVVDMDLSLPATLKLFDHEVRTIVFNTIKHEEDGNLLYYQVTADVSLVQQIVHALYHLNIQSVLVEGGARLLQSFVDEEMWDEIRRISNPQLIVESGLPAPLVNDTLKKETLQLSGDTLEIFKP
jgi:diaminohydroxyphosphoribosylaminopyrimidine deaminase / 5-amino-6-(5-phosphoribosylamino)uracil reductase